MLEMTRHNPNKTNHGLTSRPQVTPREHPYVTVSATAATDVGGLAVFRASGLISCQTRQT